MFMIALTMGMIGCSSEQKKDEISVENDSPKETVQEEVADVKTVDAKTTETEAKVTESSKSEITEETKKTTSEAEEIPLEEIPVEPHWRYEHCKRKQQCHAFFEFHFFSPPFVD